MLMDHLFIQNVHIAPSIPPIKRNTFNPMDITLRPNTTDGDYTASANNIDFLSNGFKFRTTSGGYNGSGDTQIYMAFAENPFVTSSGVPACAR